MLTTSGNSRGARARATLAWTLCLCFALAATTATAIAAPLQFGTIDEDKEQSRAKAQQALKEVGMSIDIQDAGVVRIGSSYAVDQDEVIAGDVVIIGGALTVEGTIGGDAAVIGGSMYLASTAIIKGDAVVISGIIEMEEGAIVAGDIVENPEQRVDLYEPDDIDESGNIRRLSPGEAPEPPEPPEPPELAELGERGYHISAEDGDLVKMGEDIEIGRGEVIDGDVVAIGSDIEVYGEVHGDVVTTSGDIELGPTAWVSGDVAAIFGDIEMEEGARVDGEVVTVDLSGKHFIIKSDSDDDEAEAKERQRAERIKQAMDAKGWDRKLSEEALTYKISLYAPQAEDVRLTGSFIRWDPVGIPMKRDDDGTWRTTYTFEPGMYLYKFVVDGKAIPDPDVPDKQVPDGMGGYATSLTVPSKSGKMTAVPIRFSLHRPEAYDVRVTGSFNDWDPDGVKMTKDEEGTWSVSWPVTPGDITYKFYIDGVWGPDPDVAETVPDGKGGYATPFTVKVPEKGFKLTVGKKMPEAKGTAFNPAFDYTRVDGVYLAMVLSNKDNVFPMPRFYLEGGHSKKRHRWLYSVELEQPLVAPFALSVGGSFYDKTDSYDKEIVSDIENLLAASFVKREYRDYFDRRGATGFAALRPFEHHMLKVSYTSDEYRPLETKAHSALFRGNSEFPGNPRNRDDYVQICYDPESESVVCKKIALKSMGLLYEFDSRDCKGAPSIGIWTRLGGEWAGRDFGGDLDFSRYTADLRFYSRITDRQRYAVRIAAGAMDVPEAGACGCIPDPEYFFPKQFYVGGIGTLPAYGYKEFTGTHMALVSAEYVNFLKGGLGVVFFMDGGDARGSGEETSDVIDAMKFKFDAGVGLRIEDAGDDAFTLGVAKRLDDSDRDLVVMARLTRPF